MVQLAFDLEALGLRLEPTSAMLAGTQKVAQHSWCGAVVVWDFARHGDIGACPVCDHPNDKWRRQEIGQDGLAGLRTLQPGKTPAT